uniref:VWFA domain-containing protein n=1 Tax=Panagrellus redivivus TaxID=6233 RepID=A0A7E4USE0_PANRE
MPDIIKFLHPALRVFQLVDRNVLKTKQAMDSLVPSGHKRTPLTPVLQKWSWRSEQSGPPTTTGSYF